MGFETTISDIVHAVKSLSQQRLRGATLPTLKFLRGKLLIIMRDILASGDQPRFMVVKGKNALEGNATKGLYLLLIVQRYLYEDMASGYTHWKQPNSFSSREHLFETIYTDSAEDDGVFVFEMEHGYLPLNAIAGPKSSFRLSAKEFTKLSIEVLEALQHGLEGGMYAFPLLSNGIFVCIDKSTKESDFQVKLLGGIGTHPDRLIITPSIRDITPDVLLGVDASQPEKSRHSIHSFFAGVILLSMVSKERITKAFMEKKVRMHQSNRDSYQNILGCRFICEDHGPICNAARMLLNHAKVRPSVASVLDFLKSDQPRLNVSMSAHASLTAPSAGSTSGEPPQAIAAGRGGRRRGNTARS